MTTTWTIAVAPAGKDLAETIEDYIALKRIQMVSENTVKAYRNVLSDLLKFSGNPIPHQLNAPLFKRYFGEVCERDYKRSTIRLYHAVCKDFCEFLRSQGLIQGEPMREIRRPKVQARLPRVLSDDEIKKVLRACKNTYSGRRARAIILFMLGTGVRVSEMTNLTVRDLDFNSQAVRVIGKGDKERIIPLGETLSRELVEWIDIRGRFLAGRECSVLFPTQRLTSPHRATVERMLKRYAQVAGVAPFSPHTLRHTFATRFAAGKDGRPGNIWQLRELMGHSDISTTQIYVHLAAQELRKDFGDPLRLFSDG